MQSNIYIAPLERRAVQPDNTKFVKQCGPVLMYMYLNPCTEMNQNISILYEYVLLMEVSPASCSLVYDLFSYFLQT